MVGSSYTTLKEVGYTIHIIDGWQGLSRTDDNVDVSIVFDDGSRFTATFFTLKNIQGILKRYEISGECVNGLYFYSTNMIIVNELSEQVIASSVRDLIENNEFEHIFQRLDVAI